MRRKEPCLLASLAKACYWLQVKMYRQIDILSGEIIPVCYPRDVTPTTNPQSTTLLKALFLKQPSKWVNAVCVCVSGSMLLCVCTWWGSLCVCVHVRICVCACTHIKKP